jgi:hypothetical protein
MTTKSPSLYSAADVARAISRRLRKAGYTMADTSDRYRWTEGFHVHRLGYSKTVIVDYHMEHHVGSAGYTDELRKNRAAIIESARGFLKSVGYPVPDAGNLYIECERD